MAVLAASILLAATLAGVLFAPVIARNRSLYSLGVAFAAGTLLTMVLAHVLPETMAQSAHAPVLFVLGFVAMLLLHQHVLRADPCCGHEHAQHAGLPSFVALSVCSFNDGVMLSQEAGHGLASGLRLVAEEMKGPIADEFNRVFEEQNLGIPIELALRNMADRIPMMDVRFFVIAVIIQRATGGDLAEVLDKIGRLIRQRFELFGHVKALTAEGRLSGIVLLAMPPALLAFLATVNYDYISTLFNTPAGVKLLTGTAVLQVIGAWSIKQIVSIKV